MRGLATDTCFACFRAFGAVKWQVPEEMSRQEVVEAVFDHLDVNKAVSSFG